MNPRLKALQDSLAAKEARVIELREKTDWTDEERAEASQLPDQIAAIRSDIKALVAMDQAAAEARNDLTQVVPVPMTPLSQTTAPATVGGGVAAGAAAPQTLLPPNPAPSARQQPLQAGARVIARARAKHFEHSGRSRAEAALQAYQFGMWLMASQLRNSKALRYCQEHGIPIVAAHTEGINEDGGFLVPEQFDADLIILVEKYGVFRQYALNRPMTRDTASRPRRVGGLEAHFVGERQAASESEANWDRVRLTAEKLMINTRISSELDEDAVVSMADTLAFEVSHAFAKKEDNCGFNGDGTLPYGGIVGVRQALRDVDATIANIKGLVVGSGNTYDELALVDFDKMVGTLPNYVDDENVRWFVHKRFYGEVMLRLLLAAGGVTAQEISTGAVWRNPVFLGYPVVFSQVMPSTQANSQVCAVLGDLALGADFGDRRQTTIAMSEHKYFDTDEIALRATERFDINVHGVGDTAEAGPLVGLITAAA